MRVLVTGASGFVGAAVKRAYEAEGAEVVGVDVRSAPGVLDLDLTNDEQLDRLFVGDGFDVVAHLAASAVGTAGLMASARTDPRRAVDVNVGGTVRLLQASLEHGTSHFLYASSTTVYGPAHRYGTHRITEDAPMRPTSVYGATKASAEHLSHCIVTGNDMTFTALRLPLVYGPNRWYGGALAPLHEMLVIAQPGSTTAFELDPTTTDWLHVDDAAAAFTALATVSRPEQAYHLVGHSGSMLDLGLEVAALTPGGGMTLQPKHVPDSAVFPLLDDTQAKKDFQFRPRYTDVRAAADSLVGKQGRGNETEINR